MPREGRCVWFPRTDPRSSNDQIWFAASARETNDYDRPADLASGILGSNLYSY
jgi:hypothetical protein